MSKQIQLTDQDMAEVARLSALGSVSHGDIVKSNTRVMRRRGMTPRFEKYQDYVSRVDEARRSSDPRVLRAWDSANLALKDIAPGAVHVNATMSNLSIQYANEMYIGEELMPLLPVGKESDVYFSYGKSLTCTSATVKATACSTRMTRWAAVDRRTRFRKLARPALTCVVLMVIPTSCRA